MREEEWDGEGKGGERKGGEGSVLGSFSKILAPEKRHRI